MLFDFLLGAAYLLIALNSLVAAIIVLLKDRRGFKGSVEVVGGSLVVVLIMGFIGYNTLAAGLGLPTL
jgi:hypothetical protein